MKVIFSLVVCFFTFLQITYAQTFTVTGTVTDNEGALPGANVVVRGTTTGAIADSYGRYSIEVTGQDAVLVFSFVGYENQEILVGNQRIIDVTLTGDASTFEELIVVGYGTMRRRDVTGAVTQIIPDRIANENPGSVQDILRGTPGLHVGLNNNAKGGGTMRIRGQRSVYTAGGHNDPLLILDGMIFYGELSEINPDDISQIDILKDASAAAVYGAKAANGVIIITTKKAG